MNCEGDMELHAKCQLCLKPAILCESHVISEFFFSNLYDEKHRYYALCSIRGERIELLQKGLRQELLCKTCDGQFGKYEDYAKRVLYGGGPEIVYEKLGGGNCRYWGIDYRKFKLFLMSLLWRLDVTTIPALIGVSLGPKHQERLRKMLQVEDPGEPWQYGCLIARLLHEGKPFKDSISPPVPGKYKDHHIYVMAITGFLFYYMVSSHRPAIVDEAFLRKDGSIVIDQKEITEFPFLLEIGSRIGEAARGRTLPGTKTRLG
jgi:hypothetical protein